MERIKQLFRDMNQKGISVPMLKDPKTGMASVSLTMLIISFNLVLIGLIGKASKLLEGVDVSQSLTLFGITSALYFGRTLSYNNVSVNPNSSSSDDTKEKQEGKKHE